MSVFLMKMESNEMKMESDGMKMESDEMKMIHFRSKYQESFVQVDHPLISLCTDYYEEHLDVIMFFLRLDSIHLQI